MDTIDHNNIYAQSHILISLPINTRSFCAIEENDVQYRLQVRKDNDKLIIEVEEGIRYQYELHEKTAKYLKTKYTKYDPNKISLLDKRIAISQSLYKQNFKSIHAAYTLILSGKMAASLMIARRIHESIVTQYYIGLCNENELVEYIELSEEERSQPNKLRHSYYKQKMYKRDTLKKLNKEYSKLNSFVHTTWKTIHPIEYDKKHIEYTLLNLRHSLLFNVISYVQVYDFDQKFLKTFFKFVQSFFDEQIRNVNYQSRIFFPNKKSVVGRLLWHPDKHH